MSNQEWQPIETAPKDGTWIIAFEANFPFQIVSMRYAIAQGTGGLCFCWQNYDKEICQPICWIPMPPYKLENENKWQPIETAPKDRTLWLHEDGLVLKGQWNDWDDPSGLWLCTEEPNDFNWKIEPTHWQPYYKPEPPK